MKKRIKFILIFVILIFICLMGYKIYESNSALISKAKVGDYVTYRDDMGLTRWRIFDIKDDVILITPVIGASGEVDLDDVEGYMNAIELIEKECDKFTNAELGITPDEIRSMTFEDVLEVSGLTIEDVKKRHEEEIGPVKNYAYYSKDADWWELETKEGYEAIRAKYPRKYWEEDWDLPRFYTYDSAKYTATDENGYTYAYPSGDEPVYVTNNGWYFRIRPLDVHVKNENVYIYDLLGDESGVLATLCSYSYDDYVQYGVLYVLPPRGIFSSHIIRSDEYSSFVKEGVRPLVSLDSKIKEDGTGNGDSGAPWVLCR